MFKEIQYSIKKDGTDFKRAYESYSEMWHDAEYEQWADGYYRLLEDDRVIGQFLSYYTPASGKVKKRWFWKEMFDKIFYYDYEEA